MSTIDKWTHHDIPDQSGKTAIITGSNSGIGFETAKALAGKGATVIMACRDMQKCSWATDAITAVFPHARINSMPLDLGDLQSIREFADTFRNQYDELHILINNAGVMMPPYAKTKDGFELQFGVNHLGHFALTGLLMDHLLKTEKSRIVSVSSIVHLAGKLHFDDLNWVKRRYLKYKAYGDSKLANLYFTFECQRRLTKAGTDTIAVIAHPGWTATNLQRHSLFSRIFNPILGQKPQEGAWPLEYAATSSDVNGGEYFGPRGFIELQGHPVKVKAKSLAYDEEIARRLWHVSEKMTGVHYFI